MSLFKKINFIDSEKYKEQIEEYMNSTYGHACDDSFKVVDASYSSMTSKCSIFTLASCSFPDHTILVSHDMSNQAILTNYMEVFYSMPIMDFMRQEAKEVFGPCKIIFDYTKGTPASKLDYTCSQEQFLEAVSCSFTLFLTSSCPFATKDHLPKALEALRDDCAKVGIKLKNFDVVILSRLFDGDIISYKEFEDKYKILYQQSYSYSFNEDISLIS